MKRARVVLIGLCLALLAACGGGGTPNGTWDSTSWDSATWQ